MSGVVVTGAASGIGRASAEALVADGRKVALWDIAQEVTAVADDLIRGNVPPGDVKSRIDGIMNASPRWGGWALIVAYVLSAAAFAVFFGGRPVVQQAGVVNSEQMESWIKSAQPAAA